MDSDGSLARLRTRLAHRRHQGRVDRPLQLLQPNPSSRPTELHLAGTRMQRLAPPPIRLHRIHQALLDAAIAAVLKVPSSPVFGFEDWRSRDVAERAANAPPLRDGLRGQISLGELVIYRVGGFNVAPSPAFLFRLAQHAGRLVIAYANGTLPTANRLRRVTTLEGIPVPPHLQGKIFAIGSERHIFITYDQSSDLFIDQLECMRQCQGLLKCDPLASSATVITSSGGGLDAAITRCRLEDAGFHRVFGRLVISGSMFAYPTEDPLLVWYGKRILAPLLGAFGYADVLRAAVLFTRQAFQWHLGPEKEALVDLSVGSVIGPPVIIEMQPFKMVHGNIRPAIRALVAQEALLGWLKAPIKRGSAAALLCALRGGDFASDGVIPLARARIGRSFLEIQEPHDHISLIEDPVVADAIIGHLHRLHSAASGPVQVASTGGGRA